MSSAARRGPARARRGRPRPVQRAPQAAHDGHRQPGGLALDQVARRRRARRRWRSTVALSGLPWASVPPRRSSRTAHARGADRDVGQAVAPGPAEGVGDDHADAHAERARAARRGSPRPRRRGPRAAAARCPGAVLEASTPAAAITKPVPVLDDRACRPGGRRPVRSRRRSPPRGRSPRTIRPSALLTIFEVTSEDVAVGAARASAAAISFAEVVARPDLGDARDDAQT